VKNRWLLVGLIMVAACTSSQPAGNYSPAPPSPDPRVGLKPGWFDAGEAMWNLRVVSKTAPPETHMNRADPEGEGFTNSDLAFRGNYVIQGNYHGPVIWDISNAAKPKLVSAIVCPASQNDVSVYGNLLFVSVESISGRLDCGGQGVQDTVSAERFRGVRVFDISDIAHPKLVTNVQTCRGSHTHTFVPDAKDPNNVYIYVSGASTIRSPRELPGCSDLEPEQDTGTTRFRLEVIKVPLSAPQQAAIVNRPRVFEGLTEPALHAELTADSIAAAARRDTTREGRRLEREAGRRYTQCHDITVYPAIGLAGGACRGYGLLLDIRDVVNPVRIAAVADSNFAFWHSATFSNDGSKVLFTDEWGGGTRPRCRITDPRGWGADAIFTRDGNKLTFKSYYKLPVPQTSFENCVAHNGSLIPIPGRDIMVQSWYQGGISIFEWTDPEHPREIAYFDRGPIDGTKLVGGGTWSAYWYNGRIYSSEETRGLDVFELQPSAFISQNEIDAAKLVRLDYLNVQTQPQLVWPASSTVVRAFADQAERAHAVSPARIAEVRRELDRTENLVAPLRKDRLTKLAAKVRADSQDPKASALASAITELANATR
jgi:hypothetical protein